MSLTLEGFEPDTIEDLLSAIEDSELSDIDPALDLSAETPVGQLNAIVAKKQAEVEELTQTVYEMFDPGSAEGEALENDCALVGVSRLPASKSRVTCTVTLNAATTLPAGSVANVIGQPTVRFVSESDVTSVAAGDYSVVFVGEVNGPLLANAGTLTVITAPVSGWTAVTNALDASPGRLIESDADLLARRDAEITAPGSSTVDAIRADLLQVPNVQQAKCFENNTNRIDSNGVPAHAIECVIFDGQSPTADDDVIVQAIWNSKPSGIATFGSVSGFATDSLGEEQQVFFSRVSVNPIYLSLTVTTDPLLYPADGDTQIKSALAAKGREFLKLGVQVIALVLRSAVLSVTGVIDVPAFTLGYSPSPVGTTNLFVGSREIALVDTSNIVVTS